LKIKKIDINSIFPIIINKIKLIFDDVNRFEKFKFCKLNISELTVLVKVSIDNLKDFSKPMLSNTRKLDKINKLTKKDINIRKDILTLSSDIFLSDLKIVLFIILLGLINLIISNEVIFNNI
tara:strand:+ start:955 stop:1320 length:366 start_codon:yes stop_codon:yes gene_type:complete